MIQSEEPRDHGARGFLPPFFPVARDPAAVRAAQLAVLELLKQPEGSDVTWLIRMFGGIHHKFKESLLQSTSHTPLSVVEKEE